MKFRILFFVFLFMVSQKGFSQWEWLNPLPQGNMLHSVCALNPLTCWVAGGYGTVMKTADGGTTWLVMNTGTTGRFTSIFFINALYGWVTCDDGKIFHSDDGGESWQLQYEGASGLQLTAMVFTDVNHGCAVGGNGGHSVVLITWNGGLSWTENQISTDGLLMDVSFPDILHGRTASLHGTIYETHDGGGNWSLILSAGAFAWFEMISFSDVLHGWALETHDNYLYITTDGGLTWTTKHVNYSPTDICYLNASTGYMCGDAMVYNHRQGWIKKTVNGGNTWSNPKWIDINFTESLFFTNEDCGWVVGSSGAIFKTTDGNTSWSYQTADSTHENLLSASFLQEGAKGWISGSNGVILHTDDYGHTWKSQQTGVTQYLNAVDFIDTLNGWACGDNGTVIHTNDGGSSWNLMSVPTHRSCFSLSVPAPNRVVIVCDSGIILQTSDFGNNWSFSVPDSYSQLYSVYFTDSLQGWASGYSSHYGMDAIILRTTDGGNTWEPSFFDFTSILYSIFFVNDQKGWAVGTDSVIMRTTDGGITWDVQLCPFADGLSSVYFIDEQHGAIAGDDGILLVSWDGGTTYELRNSGTNEYLNAVYVNSMGEAWCAGSNGCILHYPQLFTGITELSGTGNSGKLFISPNPLSEHANISYILREKEDVIINLYSLEGEKVATILKEVQESGPHQVTLDKVNYKPGLYICELRTLTQRLTCKMIVI